MSFAPLPYPAHGWAYKQSCQQKSASDERALLRQSNSSISFVHSALIRPSSQGSLLQKKKKKLPSHKSWIIKSWMLEFSGWIGVSVSLLFDRQHERQFSYMTLSFWPPAVGCEPQPRLALRLEPDCVPRHFWTRRPAGDERDSAGMHRPQTRSPLRARTAATTAAGFPRSRSAGNAGCRAEINHVERAVISLPSC